jgi:hypothetical protein
MKLPDAIAPYASLLKWGLIAALLLGTFVSGCSHGRAQSAQAIAKKNAALLDAAAALRASQSALQAVNNNAKAEQAAAKVQAKRAAAAEQRANEAADRLVRKYAQIEHEIELAKRDPECKRALEASTCATLH